MNLRPRQLREWMLPLFGCAILGISGWKLGRLIIEPNREASLKSSQLSKENGAGLTGTVELPHAVEAGMPLLPEGKLKQSPEAWFSFSAQLDSSYVRDPKKCASMLASRYSTWLLRDVVPISCAGSLEELLAEAGASSNGWLREDLVNEVVRKLPNDARGFALAANLPNKLKLKAYGKLTEGYFTKYGLDAVRRGLREDKLPWMAVNYLLSYTQKAAPEKAYEFILSLSNSEARGGNGKFQYLHNALEGMAPQDALKKIGDMPVNQFSNQFKLRAAYRLLTKNPDALPDLVSKDPSVISLSSGVAFSLPIEKSASIINLMPGERVRAAVIRSIVTNLQDSKKVLAEEWIAKIEDPVSKAFAADELAKRFSPNGPAPGSPQDD